MFCRGGVIARRRLRLASLSLTTDCTQGTVCGVSRWEASVAGCAGSATAAVAAGPGGHLLAVILAVAGSRGFTALRARGIGTGVAEGTRGGITGAERGTALAASFGGFLNLAYVLA